MCSTSGKRLWLVVAHRHQAVAGQDEGDRRGAGHVGVGLAHQRRRHVAGAVLDIEAAGNLDFLHVLPGRHRDPGQPLHRAVLLRRRVHRSIQTALSGNAARSAAGTSSGRIRRERTPRTWGTPEQSGTLVLTRLRRDRYCSPGTLPSQRDLTRFWQALDDRRINRRSIICGGEMASARLRFGRRRDPMPGKLNRNRNICDRKDTAGTSQRETGVLSAGISGGFRR